jgi:hypothetical protein
MENETLPGVRVLLRERHLGMSAMPVSANLAKRDTVFYRERARQRIQTGVFCKTRKH